jgi:Ferredoxin
MADTREREISGQTVRIDRTLCIGSGNCTNIAPEIYVIREDNIVDFKDETPDIEQGRLEEAASLCPVDALIVEDENGERIVPSSRLSSGAGTRRSVCQSKSRRLGRAACR